MRDPFAESSEADSRRPLSNERPVAPVDRLARRPPSLGRGLALVAGSGLIGGSLTSLGQGSLPFELSPLANSAGAWSLAAFVLARIDPDSRRAALLGATALATLLAGYAIATSVRGFPVGTSLLVFWGAASIAVGPALGVAAAWVGGDRPVRIAAGAALIAGILIGEGAYGLTVIADTTPAVYWVGEAIVGLAIAVVASVRRLGSVRDRAIGAGLTALVAAAFYVTYAGNLIGLL
jgi:hypothetical protein